MSVDVINLMKFTDKELMGNILYQEMIANATRYSIADVAAEVDANIDLEDFNVHFQNVSGSAEYVDGQLHRSLFIEQEFCLFDGGNVEALTLIIEHEADDIAASLMIRLATLFLDGESNEKMEVSVYLPTQFRFRQSLKYFFVHRMMH